MSDPWSKENIRRGMEEVAAMKPAKTIKECMHDTCRAAGLGYALCDDCGALLPDEDPDLEAKCGLPPSGARQGVSGSKTSSPGRE